MYGFLICESKIHPELNFLGTSLNITLQKSAVPMTTPGSEVDCFPVLKEGGHCIGRSLRRLHEESIGLRCRFHNASTPTSCDGSLGGEH